MTDLSLQKPLLQSVPLFQKWDINVDVLRMDEVHPVVSGNKWFKLKGWLEKAKQQQASSLATFGGAYSNHIVATAAAAKGHGLKSIGLIRGEEPLHWSDSLQEARSFGMQLMFLAREDYRLKKIPAGILPENTIVIPEGGFGANGTTGLMELFHSIDLTPYTHLLAACGTGTTLAALLLSSFSHQQLIGIPVLRNEKGLRENISLLAGPEKLQQLELIPYHFGGYAKKTNKLLFFMNQWYEETEIPSDFVYTGKLFYGLHDLVHKKFFPGGSRLLLLHTGGLQGNRSLTKGTLIF